MRLRLPLLSSLVAAALWVSACATNPYQGELKAKSDALLQQQLNSADQRRAAQPNGRILFAGFAMNSQSKAFRSDVLTVEKAMLSIDANALVFKLNNPTPGQDADWPFATAENIASVLSKVAALARAQDKVVVLFTTHGLPNQLSVNINNREFTPVQSAAIQNWLAPLRGLPTVLLVSACYSGSFLPPLRGPNRVILTASARDRNSFGCNFQSANTFFIEALFNQPDLANQPIEALMDRAKLAIDQKERAMKLSPPSLPQIFVGPASARWAKLPIKDWVADSPF